MNNTMYTITLYNPKVLPDLISNNPSITSNILHLNLGLSILYRKKNKKMIAFYFDYISN